MFSKTLLITELDFKGIRSSGAGGQHVNKTASKVELTFNLETSQVFNETQKALLSKNLSSRITKEQLIILQCGENRSQHKNKALVIDRFFELISKALIVQKPRKKTKVPYSVKLKVLKKKKQKAEKKANRKRPKIE
ncbi:alternative ribosome rescue aminoacyl-tRNA hydrolase ArfB [Lacinutrix undariae]